MYLSIPIRDILSYISYIYYDILSSLNIAPGLGYDPHNDWTSGASSDQ